MSPFPRVSRLAALGALMLGAACASAPKATNPTSSTAVGARADVITAAEIESRGMQTSNAYDVVRRLRARFLTFHGVSGSSTAEAGQVLVSLDGGALNGVGALRTIPAGQVAEIRYLSASDAAQRFGTSANSGPVILVRQK